MTNQHQTSQLRAKEIFSKASPEHQALIRDILREEREVQHLKKKADIHVKIYDHIRRIIK